MQKTDNSHDMLATICTLSFLIFCAAAGIRLPVSTKRLVRRKAYRLSGSDIPSSAASELTTPQDLVCLMIFV
jgi:hypothetical protein